jgi:uncharacterized UBP type Zn finger protein
MNVSLPECHLCNVPTISHSRDDQEDEYITPSSLLYAIWIFVDYMAGYAQQDAHEFLIAFLNTMDMQLSQTSNSTQANEKLLEVRYLFRCGRYCNLTLIFLRYFLVWWSPTSLAKYVDSQV